MVTAQRLTVAALLDQWLESCKNSIRPMTYVSYEGIVRGHIVPELGTVPIQRLTPQHIDGLLARKLRSGLSPTRVRYILVVFRVALRRAEKWGLVPRNVAALVAAPKVERQQASSMTLDQARRLLEAASGDRLEGLYCVALALGLRQGEALGLRWRDVDLEHRTLRVDHALQRIEGRLVLTPTKTDRSRRTVAMPATVVEALRRHRAHQREERLAAGGRWPESDFVFTTIVGTPCDPDNLRRSFRALLKRAALPHFRFHDLRHSAASLLLAQGVAARVVMETLGHSRISVTLDTYSHVTPELQREAATAMDRVFNRPNQGVDQQESP